MICIKHRTHNCIKCRTSIRLVDQIFQPTVQPSAFQKGKISLLPNPSDEVTSPRYEEYRKSQKSKLIGFIILAVTALVATLLNLN